MIRIIIHMDCCVYTCMIFHEFYLKKMGVGKPKTRLIYKGVYPEYTPVGFW